MCVMCLDPHSKQRFFIGNSSSLEQKLIHWKGWIFITQNGGTESDVMSNIKETLVKLLECLQLMNHSGGPHN